VVDVVELAVVLLWVTVLVVIVDVVVLAVLLVIVMLDVVAVTELLVEVVLTHTGSSPKYSDSAQSMHHSFCVSVPVYPLAVLHPTKQDRPRYISTQALTSKASPSSGGCEQVQLKDEVVVMLVEEVEDTVVEDNVCDVLVVLVAVAVLVVVAVAEIEVVVDVIVAVLVIVLVVELAVVVPVVVNEVVDAVTVVSVDVVLAVLDVEVIVEDVLDELVTVDDVSVLVGPTHSGVSPSHTTSPWPAHQYSL